MLSLVLLMAWTGFLLSISMYDSRCFIVRLRLLMSLARLVWRKGCHDTACVGGSSDALSLAPSKLRALGPPFLAIHPCASAIPTLPTDQFREN